MARLWLQRTCSAIPIGVITPPGINIAATRQERLLVSIPAERTRVARSSVFILEMDNNGGIAAVMNPPCAALSERLNALRL